MKLGFIGGWGHHYLRALLAEKASEISIAPAVAGDGIDADAARRLATALGVATWYDSPEKMFAGFKPDGVSVGAVYGHNGEIIAEALRRNIPVVSDKPVAATWEQLSVLRELAQDQRRILVTEFDFRCRPEFRAAQEAIARKLIGDVILVSAQKSYRFGTRPSWYANRASYGGTLLWIASHAVDAAQWITGLNIKKVIGRQGNLSRPDYGTMEDHLALLIELENGATGVIHADFLRPAAAATHGDDRIRIAGSKGVLEVREGRCKLIAESQGEIDITGRAIVRPIHLELLAALQGEKSEWFSTAISLATAEVLLHARDACDRQAWVQWSDR
ncbi:MAG: Gfo/Idh/MocA family oxidoreductase [Tepidisphaeraceae bacterium]